MSYYVYIIQSEVDGTYYKGSSQNPIMRLEQHNLGLSKYTSIKTPWKLVYIESLQTKTDMLIREKKLKRGNRIYFEQIINSNKNILNTFL